MFEIGIKPGHGAFELLSCASRTHLHIGLSGLVVGFAPTHCDQVRTGIRSVGVIEVANQCTGLVRIEFGGVGAHRVGPYCDGFASRLRKHDLLTGVVGHSTGDRIDNLRAYEPAPVIVEEGSCLMQIHLLRVQDDRVPTNQIGRIPGLVKQLNGAKGA